MSQFRQYHPTIEGRYMTYGFDCPLITYFYNVYGPDPDEPDEEIILEQAGLTESCNNGTLFGIMLEFACPKVLLDEVLMDMPMGHVLDAEAYHKFLYQGQVQFGIFADYFKGGPKLRDAVEIGDQLKIRLRWSDEESEDVWCTVIENARAESHLEDFNRVRAEINSTNHEDEHHFQSGDEVFIHGCHILDHKAAATVGV